MFGLPVAVQGTARRQHLFTTVAVKASTADVLTNDVLLAKPLGAVEVSEAPGTGELLMVLLGSPHGRPRTA